MEEELYTHLQYLGKENIEKLKNINKLKPFKGFVLNTSKISIDDFNSYNLPIKQDSNFPNLYRYDLEKFLISKSLFHELGVIYIMDPSSFIVSTLFNNDKQRKLVLDMCAAPGGKTISYALNNKNDIVISNDFSFKRALELKANIERLGLDNVIVTSLEPKVFLNYFENSFDRVILDTPCSGSGMFRKEEKMVEDFSYAKVEKLLPIQQQLLNIAASLVKDGGELIYSTCSYLKEEDEDQITTFLSNHEEFELANINLLKGYTSYLKGSFHLFPFNFKGEGHFICKLIKKGDYFPTEFKNKLNFDKDLNLYTLEYDKEKYAIKDFISPILKLKPLSIGIQITDNDKFAKYNFSYQLSRYKKENVINISENEAIKYIKGEELKLDNSSLKGIYTLCYNNIPISYTNIKNNIAKNYYPKYLRKNIYPYKELIKNK